MTVSAIAHGHVAEIPAGGVGYAGAGIADCAAALAAALADDGCAALVLDLRRPALALPSALAVSGSGTGTGADLAAAEREAAALAQRIAEARKPVVALLGGLVEGPALALALAAGLRIGTEETRLWFPEVRLGLMPGAGAPMRAARLAGAGAVLPAILSARPLAAAEAQAAGLVEIVTGDAPGMARMIAARLAAARGAEASAAGTSGNSGTDETPEPPGLAGALRAFRRDGAAALRDPADYLTAVQRARSGLRPGTVGQAGRAVVDCVEAALLLPPEAAEAMAAEAFALLAGSLEAGALLHLARSEAALKDLPFLPPEEVVLLGDGAPVAAMALALISAGVEVLLYADEVEALRRTLETVATRQDDALVAGRLSEAERDAAWERIGATSDPAALAGRRLGIELLSEGTGARAGGLGLLRAALGPDAVLLTTTVWNDPRRLAREAGCEGALLGLHLQLPLERVPVMELALPEGTAAPVLAAGTGLVRALGKTPLPVTLGPGRNAGYPANRLLAAFRQAAQDLVDLGAGPAAVDAALRAFGFNLGPFEVLDRLGLEACLARMDLARRQGTAPAWQDGGRIEALLAAGRGGRAAGRGFLLWPEPEQGGAAAIHGLEDPDFPHPFPAGGRRPGVTLMRQACLAALANEGARMLSEGLVPAAGGIDLVAVATLGFPRHRGGPMFWAGASGGRTGLLAMRNVLRSMHEACAAAFPDRDTAFWQPDALWEARIREGRLFD